jgi:hypothetical protein
MKAFLARRYAKSEPGILYLMIRPRFFRRSMDAFARSGPSGMSKNESLLKDFSYVRN